MSLKVGIAVREVEATSARERLVIRTPCMTSNLITVSDTDTKRGIVLETAVPDIALF